MIGLAVLIVLFLVAFLICFRAYFNRMWDRLQGIVPPGPLAFPILGTIAFDAKRPDLTFRKWAKQYGKMFSFYVGDRFCVAVTDMNLIRRLLTDSRLAGRSQKGINPMMDVDVVHGIVMNEGEQWKEQRRFSLSALRDFGFGKKGGEDKIQRQAEKLLDTFKRQSGQPFNPRLPLANAVSNVIASMLFGETLDESDPRFKMFVENNSKNLQEAFGVAPMEKYPWLRYIPPFSKRFEQLTNRVKEAFGVLNDMAMDHKKDFDKDNIRDYIDAFIQMQNKAAESFTDEQLVQNLGDIYIAGFETTTTFLKWAVIYMINYPGVQLKMQAEIDHVIGQRFPTYSDKQNCPYTDAVITEMFRMSTFFVPFGVPHRALQDMEVDGFRIPKDTEVWPVLTHCFSDPDKWDRPEEFIPERFLDKDGKTIQGLVDEVQPFLVGKRACLGEPLARMEAFVFLTAIAQKFTLLPDAKSPPSLEPAAGSLLRNPQNFEIVAAARS